LLPLYTQRKKWKNRVTASVELPLFPNYIFVRLSIEEHGRLLRLPGILSTVGTHAGPAAIPDREIEDLRRAVSCRTVEPHPYLTAGEAVRVCSGALAGLTGVVVRKANGMRFVVTLDSIQKSVAMEISAEDLEPLFASARGDVPTRSLVA
jgi:transcription antitermination factor NusG